MFISDEQQSVVAIKQANHGRKKQNNKNKNIYVMFKSKTKLT